MNNYDKVAAAAKSLARDILRSQMAARIQEKITNARNEVIAAIRAMADMKRNWAKSDADKAEEDKKRADNRAAFDAALAGLTGVTADELKLATDAVAKDRADKDAQAAEDASALAESRTKSESNAQDKLAEARKSLVHHQDNMTKLNDGEMKVDAEELKALTAKLIEEGRVTELENISAED